MRAGEYVDVWMGGSRMAECVGGRTVRGVNVKGSETNRQHADAVVVSMSMRYDRALTGTRKNNDYSKLS